jgi:Ca2+-transporting ATPase
VKQERKIAVKLLDVLHRDLNEVSEVNPPRVPQKQPAGLAGPPGLTSHEAQRLLEKNGKNQLASGKRISAFKIFISQFKDILVIILLISTIVSACMGEFVEAAAIAVIVVLNGIMGFIQEFNTEKTLEALKKMAAPTARVYRDGVLRHVPAEDLVAGDVLELEAGDKVPADGLILHQTALAADESILTGESVPVDKFAGDPALDPDSQPEDAQAFMGAIITKGRARVRIVKTGMQTRMGGIAGMLGSIEESQTPLQHKLDELGKYIAIGCLIICAIVAGAGILHGENAVDMLITGVSLAVAAVPEGLPAIVTIALALAVKRMVRRRALIRRLHAVETLGCASVICSDKTGTLTQNKMTVKQLYVSGHTYALSGDGYELEGELTENGRTTAPGKQLKRLLDCAVLCNNASLCSGEGDENKGDPTELSLLVAAAKAGAKPAQVLSHYSKMDENPFDSVKKYMTVTVKTLDGKTLLFLKGAVDVLMHRCATFLTEEGTAFLNRQKKAEILEQNERMAGEALRVIGFAYKELPFGASSREEQDFTFIGLAGMIDPPRKEARKAIRICNKAGIRTIMITGDHKTTATAIAEQIGIFHTGDHVITGSELESMSDHELDLLVNQTTVFARVSPHHKLRIVQSLKRHGHVVAMTGDGVNDAPAVKEADIGVSMGIGGSDVTKEASDLILLDDNFATLVAAVEEGRVIYSNIRKFIRYLLSCNIGEVLTMFVGILMGLPVVLLPIQILLVNLATDGPPAIALGLEPAEDDVMSRRPRRRSDSVFSGGLLTTILFRGCLIGLTTLAVFTTFFDRYHTVDIARTAAFLTLVLTQLIHVFECKSETKTIFSVPYFNNVKLIFAVLLSAAVVFGAIYIPLLQPIFSTVALSGLDLLTVFLYCLAVPVLSALFKWITRHFTSAKNRE